MAKVKTLDVMNPKLNKETKLPWWIKLNEETGKKTVLINELGKDILSDNPLIWIEIGSKLKMYRYTKNGYWTETTKQSVRHLITKKLDGWDVWNSRVSKDTADYVFNTMQIKTREETMERVNPNVVQFKNGYYSFKDDVIKPNKRTNYIFNGRDYDLDMTSDNCEMVDDWLTESVGKEAKKFIYQFLGFTFYRSYDRFQAFCILLADGGNGKSTFLRYVNEMIGENNISNVSLQKLCDPKNRFDLSLLSGKELNDQADISSGLIKDTSLIKSITGGDKISIEKKGEAGYSTTLYAKCLYGTNSLPEFIDSSVGFERRAYVLKFKRIDDFRSRYSLKTMNEQIPAFAYRCIRAFRELLLDETKDRFFETPEMILDRDKWLESNNVIQEFVSDVMVLDPEGYAEKTKVYSYYSDFCKNNNYKALTSSKFRQELEKFGVIAAAKRINKIQTRIYKGIKFK